MRLNCLTSMLTCLPLLLPWSASGASLPQELCHGRAECRLVKQLPLTVDGAKPVLVLAAVHVGKRWELWRLRTDVSSHEPRLLSDVDDNALGGDPKYLPAKVEVLADPSHQQPGRLVLRSSQGHLTKSSVTLTAAILPLRPLELAVNDGFTATRAQWSWVTQSGTGDHEVGRQTIGDAGVPPKGPFCNRERVAFLPIPIVAPPDAWTRAEWRTTPIGDCGTGLDRAFRLAGERLQPVPSARLAVVEGVLFANIPGGPWVTGASSWVNDDHLEVWCGDADAGWARQWGVRLADGKVFVGHGSPKEAVNVDRAELPGGTTALRITLPRCPRLTVSLSKADGHRVASLLSTSELCFGDPRTLGEALALPSTLGRCAPRDGRLDFVESAEPSAPLLGPAP